jgi:hypothetical protein
MTPTFEQAIKVVSALPQRDWVKVREWIDENLQETEESKRDKLSADEENFRKSLKWIDENREKYDGQFVVVENGELIAHGADAKALYAEARARGIKTPFVKRIRAKVLPFGGW